MSSKPYPPLIVAGMHRSGTSLAASLLESAGLDVGDRLMEGNWSNPRGHFEDLDFVEFHKDALQRIGIHTDGWATRDVPSLPDDLVDRARTLILAKEARGRPWGFKDPRGTLFLRLWETISPGCHFVFVHRPPWEVVDSLYRRADPVFDEDPELAIRVWQYYGRTIAEFSDSAPGRTFIVDVATIVKHPTAWVAAVSDWAGIGLRAPRSDVYESDLLHGSQARARANVVIDHYPEAIRLFGALEARAWRPAGTSPEPFRGGSTPEEERELAIRDWHRLCATERERDALKAELLAKTSESPREP